MVQRRRKVLIKRAREKIIAKEVTIPLCQTPGFDLAADILAAGREVGERVCAVLATREAHAATLGDARRLLERFWVAGFKFAECLGIVDHITTTCVVKLDKTASRKILRWVRGWIEMAFACQPAR